MDKVEVDTEKRFRKWTRVESPYCGYFCKIRISFKFFFTSRMLGFREQQISSLSACFCNSNAQQGQVKRTLNFWLERFWSNSKEKKTVQLFGEVCEWRPSQEEEKEDGNSQSSEVDNSNHTALWGSWKRARKIKVFCKNRSIRGCIRCIGRYPIHRNAK